MPPGPSRVDAAEVGYEGKQLQVRTVTTGGNVFATVPAAELALEISAAEAHALTERGSALLRTLSAGVPGLAQPNMLLLTTPVNSARTTSAGGGCPALSGQLSKSRFQLLPPGGDPGEAVPQVGAPLSVDIRVASGLVFVKLLDHIGLLAPQFFEPVPQDDPIIRLAADQKGVAGGAGDAVGEGGADQPERVSSRTHRLSGW
jgi:hypothetical protein